MPTKPTTPAQYLKDLPDDRREALKAVRKVINANLPAGYKEGIQYGMIGWFVPHSVEPRGYHCDPRQPIPFASVASQKSHIGIYLFCVYCDPALKAWFVSEWKKTGKRLDMGASCIRVKNLEGIPLELIGETVRRVPCEKFLKAYETLVPEKALAKWNKGAAEPAAKKTTKKSTSKKTTKKPASKKAASKKVAKKSTAKKTTKKAASKKRVAKKRVTRKR